MNTRCLLSMLLAAGLAAAAEIGNDRLSLTLNAGGTPTSLRDKLTGRELLAGGPQRLLALDLSDGAPTSKRATYAPTLPGRACLYLALTSSIIIFLNME